MTQLEKLQKEIKSNKNSQKALVLQRFFKTGKGEYGEGDIFYGIVVPIQRSISKKYLDLTLTDLQKLIKSKIHEERLISLFILIQKHKKADEIQKEKIFNFYLKNTKRINNWDLVDLSAPNIIGDYLLNKNRQILYELAGSSDLWEKRIAVLATFAFIRQKDFKDALKISKILLNDRHDLIHKAVGWMLREIGKRNLATLEDYLQACYKKMPRTMLRYAIEKMEKNKRKFYLGK
ncbi:MAG: DNA alkylation repair protein [Candidatus Buchananbacteria bacterium]